MKMTIIFIITIFFIFLFFRCNNSEKSTRNLNCPNIHYITKKIYSNFKTDTISYVRAIIQEEIYFSKINCIVITLSNPTFKAIDFKKVALGQRLEDYESIKSKVKNELLQSYNYFVPLCEIKKDEKIIFRIVKDQKSEYQIPLMTIDYEI